MPRCAKLILGLAVAGALGGLLVAWSGIVNVGASTGHWAITDVVLHWAMRQSVETHSLGIEAPPLDDVALARRAAGHYAVACAPCHGAPGLQRSPVARQMTPQPPFLPHDVTQWDDEELYWIVQHGVKFTAMPAWPARARADELWAMVAFLRRLPAMDGTAYRALAHGGDGVQPSLAEDAGCVRCHGSDGRGTAAFPRLAGQNADYLFAALQAYAEGRRHSGFMQAAAAGLDAEAMRDLAEHYAGATAPAGEGSGEAPGDAAAGGALARGGDPQRGVPACASCHGLAEGPRFAHYPALAGQQAWYLALQLRLLKAGERGGSPYAHIMQAVAERLDEEQIDDLAAFYAGLPAADEQR